MRTKFHLFFVMMLSLFVVACQQGGSSGGGETTSTEGGTASQPKGRTDGGELYAGMTPEEVMREVLGSSPIDEFNPDVTDEMRGKEKPMPGGILRVRTPSDFEGFNPLLSSTVNSRQVESYLFDSMVGQDSETLEYFPSMAYMWSIADLVKLPGEERVEATLLERGDESNAASTVKFVPGAWRHFIGKFEVAEADIEGGRLTLKPEYGGETYEGEITERQYVYEVNEALAPAGQERVVETTIGELDTWNDPSKGARPFAKRECAYIFKIRDGIEWHDGEPMTARDVKFTFDTIMNVNVEAQNLRSYLQDVTLCELVGENAIHFQSNRPYYKMFDALVGIITVIPEHIFNPSQFGGNMRAFATAFNEHKFRESPIGNGPFKFAEWKKEDYVRLVRNENYWKNKLPDGAVAQWQKGQPWLNGVQYTVIRDRIAGLKELQKGNIDHEDTATTDIWLQADTNTPEFKSKFVRVSKPGFGYTYIGWNNAKPIFQDVQTRRALAMLIPRDRIIRDIHNGLFEPVSCPFFSRGPEVDPTVEMINYDPAEATRLLRRAGWLDRDNDGVLEKEIDGKMVPFEMEYLIHNALEYHQKVADIVKESVEQAGIRVTIRKLDFAVYSDEVREKKFDAVRFAWSSSPDSDPSQIWHSDQIKEKGDNFISYKNERLDELIELHREEFDPLKRWEMKREMHRIIYEEQPVCFLFSISDFMFYNRKLHGVKFYPSFLPTNYTEWYWTDEQRRSEKFGN